MAGLFAADVQVVSEHLFEDVAVTHAGADDFAACGGETFVEAEIAHYRGDERFLGQLVALEEIEADDGQHFVAVEEGAGFIAADQAVGVAIVREADLRAEIAGRLLD